jgi:hypothetical protein
MAASKTGEVGCQRVQHGVTGDLLLCLGAGHRHEMDQEGGLIRGYGPGDDGVMAFTDFGIETLIGLIEIYKADLGG